MNRQQSNPCSMNRRQFLQLTGGAATVLALSACTLTVPAPQAPAAAPTMNEPQRGGILRVAFSEAVTTLDQAIPLGVTDVQVGFQLYNTLAQRNEDKPDSPITPLLAESWEVSDDAKLYTFHLRQGVTFHHGTPFTAKDVEYTINRLFDPNLGGGVGASLSSIEKVEVVDDYTVKFHLRVPDVALPYAIAGAGVGIVPHDRTTEQLATEAAGTGAFVVAEHLPGERLVLKRNENFWDKELPYLDEIQMLIIPEAVTQISALASGTVDMLYQITLENLAMLQATPDVMVHENALGVYPVFLMNVRTKPFDDVRVRQAFKHAVDRPALQQAMLAGHGAVGNDQPIAAGTAFWADIEPLAYDVEKAKALLAEAGLADGLEVTLSLSDLGGPRVNDAAVAIQEMVKAAGITLTIEKVPTNTFYAERYMQAPFFGAWWPAFSEPTGILPLAYTSTAPYNESGWSDPQVDELIASAQGETDTEKRKQTYATIQQLISEQGGVLIPYFAPFLQATRTNLHGLRPGVELHARLIWLA